MFLARLEFLGKLEPLGTLALALLARHERRDGVVLFDVTVLH